MWESIEQIGWVTIPAHTGWLYVTVSVIHYFTLLFFIGTIILVDLRILGVAAGNQTIAQLAEQVLLGSCTQVRFKSAPACSCRSRT